MPSRQWHVKSRHGCTSCKFRKVKCDDTRPICKRCMKNDRQCHYNNTLDTNKTHSTTSPFLSQSTATLEEAPLRANTISPGLDRNIIPAKNPTQFSSVSDNMAALPGNWHGEDRALFDHYLSSTYLTLSSGPSYDEIWQLAVPHEAYNNSFLMHALLTISALHLAHLHTMESHHYMNLAIQHQTAAVAKFRQILDSVTKKNAASIFLVSSLLVCISLAQPQDPSWKRTTSAKNTGLLHRILEMFNLARGIKPVLSLCWPWVQESPIAPLLSRSDLTHAEDLLGFDIQKAFNRLEADIGRAAESVVRRNAYLDATKLLRDVYPHGRATSEHKSTVLAWPVMVSRDFHLALLETRPVAIVILAFWGTILHSMRETWWIETNGQQIVALSSEILGPEWQDTLIWPRACVGLDEGIK